MPGHLPAGGSRLLLPVLVAAVLLVPPLAGFVLSSADAREREDADDARGPLDLASVKFTQKVKRIVFNVNTHNALPGTKALDPYPSRVGSDDERYLCLKLHGRRIGKRLLCVGGKGDGGRRRLGYSRYGETGRTRKVGGVPAQIVRAGKRTLKISFPMNAAGLVSGAVFWRALSGWIGPRCLPDQPSDKPPDESPGGPLDELPIPTVREGRASGRSNQCLDREPNRGSGKERLYPVRRAGCTRDEEPIVSHGSRARKRIALTFDDGPSGYTSQILSILNEREAAGTFFVIGDQTAGRADVLSHAAAKGHELANHSMHHDAYPSESDMRRTSALIEKRTGFRPCNFRPPARAVNDALARDARDAGMATILWDVDTRDWTTPGSSAIYQEAVSEAQPGSIILMHDGGGNREQTVDALPNIIRNLRSRGFRLVTVTKLLRERFIWREVH